MVKLVLNANNTIEAKLNNKIKLRKHTILFE